MRKVNPLRSFLDRYAGGVDTELELTDELVADLLREYEALYERILGKLTVARGSVTYASYAKQTQILKQIGEILDRFDKKAGGYFERSTRAVAKYASKVAISDLEALMSPAVRSATWHYAYNEEYVKRAYTDSYKYIAARTDRMSETIKQMMRQEATMVFRRAAVEGVSSRVAHKRLLGHILTLDPDFKFVDRAGRRWDNRVYFEMLARTVMHQTQNEIYLNSLAAEGHDLVKISAIGSKDACSHWEGRVLSITGKTKGYATISEAKATGEVFHPRCRHTIVAYDPEMEGIFEAVAAGKTNKEILGE